METICRESDIEPIQFLPELHETSRSISTHAFAKVAYSAPSSQMSFIETVWYLIPGLPYQCGYNKWIEFGIANHTWLVLRKVCTNRRTSFECVFDSILETYIFVPNELSETLVFKLVDKKHGKRVPPLPHGYFLMPITDFGGIKSCKFSD